MLDRTIAPVAGKLNDKFELQTANSQKLDNGVLFHTLLAGNQEAIRLEFIFNGGSWNQQKLGASYFTTKLLSAGTLSYTSKEIENRLALAGAFLDLESNNEKNTIVLYVLAKHLESLLPLMYELITQPTFPDTELENLKNITQQNLSVNLGKTSYLASTNFKETLFGVNHPYGRSLTEEVIDGVDRATLLAFFNQTFSASNCDIIISGNGSIDFTKIMNQYFGQSAWGNSQKPAATNHLTKYQPEQKLIERPSSVQSSIRVGMPLFNISHPDYLEMAILVEILGGYFGSRLMKNIREDKGFTYGISASLVSMVHDGYFVIGTDVNGDNVAATLSEIYFEIEQLRTILVEDEELNLVKNYLTGSFLNSLNTPFALADRFKSIYFNQLPNDFYTQYVNTIEKVTSERLQQLANKYLVKSNFSEIVVGKK